MTFEKNAKRTSNFRGYLKLASLAAIGSAVLLMSSSAWSANGMLSEREQMMHAPIVASAAQTQKGLWDAYTVLTGARLSSFYNPGAEAEYYNAIRAAKTENYRLANMYLDDVWAHMRQYPFENVDNPRVY